MKGMVTEMAWRAVKIDGKKLRRELEMRDVTLKDAAETCGFEASYMSRACRVNRISQPGINLLYINYHIPYDNYKVEEEPEVEVVEEPVETVDTKVAFTLDEEAAKELYKVIYSAVYEAVKKAWAE